MTSGFMAARHSALACTALCVLLITAMCGARASADWVQIETTAESGHLQAAWGSDIADVNEASWSGLGTGVDYTVEALAVDRNGRLYAGGYFTTAGGIPAARVAKWDGTTWSALGTGTHGGYFALAVDEHGNLHTGTARWDGSTWSNLGSGLDGSVRALSLRVSADLFVGGSFSTAGGTPAANVALWHEPTPSPVPLDGTARAGVTLLDSAPNPFNPQTTLRFDLHNAALARLAIYDLRGRLVRSLVDEYLSPGVHETTWNGRDDKGAQVASGTYLARIDAGAQQATTFLTLIR